MWEAPTASRTAAWDAGFDESQRVGVGPHDCARGRDETVASWDLASDDRVMRRLWGWKPGLMGSIRSRQSYESLDVSHSMTKSWMYRVGCYVCIDVRNYVEDDDVWWWWCCTHDDDVWWWWWCMMMMYVCCMLCMLYVMYVVCYVVCYVWWWWSLMMINEWMMMMWPISAQ